MNAISTVKQPGRGRARLQSILFWTWNIICLALILFGFVPNIFPQMIRSIQDGTTPPMYLAFAMFLVLIPVVSVVLGFFALRKSPSRLFALGYVLEWPLLLILLFRFSLIREGNLSITILLSWLAVALATFLWHLLDRQLDERRPEWIYLRLAGLALLFAGTIYAATWLAFYVPPIAVYLWQAIKSMFEGFINFFRHPFNIQAFGDLRYLPISILAVLLGIFSGSLIVLMPVTAPVIAGRAWLHSLRTAFKTGGRPVAWAVSLLPVAGVILLVVLSMRQPQAEAFALLEKPPATPQQAQVLLKEQDKIRAGLLNAYLAPYRYMSAVGEVRHINGIYTSALGMTPEAAWKFEQAYEVVIRPLLYTPVHPSDSNTPDNSAFTNETNEAATLYQNFFDRPIVQGEQKTIVAAVRENSNGAQAEAAWQAVDDREVFLSRQEVTIAEHGDWADVELHEVYQNRTNRRKEVLYYFNLPESAVITGLWLGPTDDRSQSFVYQVAPRGAAQAVYRNEIRLNADPALVEQIGPRQYRLRAFPVEPRQWLPGSDTPTPGPALHLWLTYRVMAADNAWPLPQLAQKFNVFWDGSSIRLINGKPLLSSATAWLPAFAQASQTVKAVAHRIDFPNGQTVIARPASSGGTSVSAAGLHLAVVLDRSFSMAGRSMDVKATLINLKNITSPGNEPDIYLTSSAYRGEAPSRVTLASFNPDQVMYFGGQNAADLLSQFQQLQDGQSYDAILVITDGSGFELGQGKVKLKVPDAPVWVLHLGNGFPLGYDDPTQQAIQASGGGIAGSLEEALTRFYAARTGAGQIDFVDGYEWQTLPTSQANTQTRAVPANLSQANPEEAGFVALAARRVILAEMFKNKGALDQLPILDQLHQLAIDNSIVTPYSSMLVLVDDRQRSLLQKLEAQFDRFDREVENIGDTSRVNPNIITGVPEPQEWLLMALAVLASGYLYWRKLAVKPSVFHFTPPAARR